jgi:hypothetical protein
VPSNLLGRRFLARHILYPEDGGDTILRNVVLCKELHGALSQKTANFIPIAVETSNPTIKNIGLNRLRMISAWV